MDQPVHITDHADSSGIAQKHPKFFFDSVEILFRTSDHKKSVDESLAQAFTVLQAAVAATPYTTPVRIAFDAVALKKGDQPFGLQLWDDDL